MNAIDHKRRELLFEILSFARPHDTPTERMFNREFLDKVPGMLTDPFGNRYLRIGKAPILWSSHVDTVARYDGPQSITFDAKSGIVKLAQGKPKQSLGADDGVGIWIMLNMIEAGMEGLYVFHRGEEVGCLGSEYIATRNPGLLDGIQAAIAFDRAGYSDIITHQSFGMTASDAFAQSLADQLNATDRSLTFRPDDTGVYTDTNTYAHLIPECSNVSVGYFQQHSHNERLDVYHAETLLDAVLKLDLSKLVIEREAGDAGFSGYYSGGGGGGWNLDDFSGYSTLAEMEDAVAFYPEAAAVLLMKHGVNVDDLIGYERSKCQFPSEASADTGVNERLLASYQRSWGEEEGL